MLRENKWICRAIGGLVIVYVCFVTFSIQFEAVKPGLDESWAWALNAVPHTNYLFGKDVVFTYGPLGFLMCPRPLAHNLQWAAAFAVCIQAIFAVMLGASSFAARTCRGFLLFLAGFVAANAFGMWMWGEYFYRFLVGLCLVVATLDSPFAIPACVLAGVLAPVFLVMKFSIGLTCASMMGVTTLILIFRQNARQKIFALWLSAAVSLAFLVFLLFGNPGNFARWLALSWEVASGYGAAMSVAGSLAEAAAAALLLAALLLSALLLEGPARVPSLLFAIPAAMAFKHGFVGDTGMATGYFTFMVAIASAVFLVAKTRDEWRLSGLLWALMSAAAIYKGIFLLSWSPITLGGLYHRLSGQEGLQALRNVWDSRQLALELQAESSRRLVEERLPARWVAAMKATEGGVDVFPSELTYLPANDLSWRPSLVLQQYSSYTHSLDRAMTERLGSDGGPSALLMQFVGNQGLQMLLDTPLLFQQILANYEFQETDESRNLLWVRRRANMRPAAGQTQIIGSTRIQFGQWVTPPRTDSKLFAQFFMKPNVQGAIRQILWKTPPVYLRLEYENGEQTECRMLPATASGGVLINYPPNSLQDLADLLGGYAFHKVRRFQIAGPGASSFHRDFEVNWVSDNSPFADYSQPGQTSDPEAVSVVPDQSDRQSRMFTVTARDQGGYRRLKYVKFIANETDTAAGGCYLRYQIDKRILWLMDSEEDFTRAGLVGSLRVLENAKCTVNLAESWPEFRGDAVTLHLNLALKPKVRAMQRIFASAIDEKGTASKLAEFAPWKPALTGVQENPWKFPPTPPTVSVEPKKLAEPDKYVLKVHLRDVNSTDDIEKVEVLVNSFVTGPHACYVLFDARTKTIMLFNDAGTAALGPIGLGTSNQLSNSYCTVAAPDPVLVNGSYDGSLSLELSLTEKMLNKRTIWVSAMDREGLRQNWGAAAVLPAP